VSARRIIAAIQLDENSMNERKAPWHRELNRYHWFVLTVAALGWLFDTMDQQLFNLARVPAMNELLAPAPGVRPDDAVVAKYGAWATAIFLMGWATGGLFFGMLGDRIGRAKTMLWTILLYSLCTGLSALSQGFWDFAFYRFVTGLGVGGEFAVGVALVAEVMPSSARPFALGLLQALSAVGNVTAALISIGLGHMEESGIIGTFQIQGVPITAWRMMFVIGTLPALLAVLIRRRLKEPERWQAAVRSGAASKPLGSYAELLGDPRWRRRALVGLVMATSGVIGLWGIGFFSIDLNRAVLRKVFENEAREAGQTAWDRDLMRIVTQQPSRLNEVSLLVKPNDLLNSTATSSDAQALWEAALDLSAAGKATSASDLLDHLNTKGQTPEQRAMRQDFLAGEPTTTDLTQLAENITGRSKEIRGRLTRWAGYTSMMLNIGAFFGIYGFSILTNYVGRRAAFAISFIAGGLTTALVFWKMDDLTDIFWMIPLMGFCLLSLFGGYAIYFPELFPTRLRSTGTSFCYNVGRFVAASGPFTLGYLTSNVFAAHPEPMRPAGVAMCLIFLLGLLVLPFAPETRNQPLPE
jgi:MFS family permease